jgi:hypothetical protein
VPVDAAGPTLCSSTSSWVARLGITVSSAAEQSFASRYLWRESL